MHAKGSSSGEKSGYFFDGVLVAVGSKLVQEGEIKQTQTLKRAMSLNVPGLCQVRRT